MTTDAPPPLLLRLVDRVDGAHLRALVALLLGSLLVMANTYQVGAEPKWDGANTDTYVRHYVATGYDLARVPEAFEQLSEFHRALPRFPHHYRIAYTFTIGRLHQLFGIDLATAYVLVSVLAYGLAAFFLYLLLVGPYGLQPVNATLGAAWLLVSPHVALTYELVAHPEAMVVLASAAFVYLHRAGHPRLAAVAIVLGLWTKESAFFVFLPAAYEVARSLLASPTDPGARRAASWYGAALALGLGLPRLLVPVPGADRLLLNWDFTRYVLSQNYGHVVPYLLHDLDVLWVPFGLALLDAPAEVRRQQFWLLVVLTLLLTAMVDWWRNWYAVLIVYAIPLAARYVEASFTRTGGRAAAAVAFAGLALLHLRHDPFLRIADVQARPLWPFYVVLGVFLANAIVAHLRPAPPS